MEAMTITEAAEHTGFTASALRFYENAGLVTPDGACDDRCGCTTDTPTTGPSVAGAEGWVGATIIPAHEATSGVPIVCTLGPDNMDERIATWQHVVADTITREAIDNEVRLQLPRSTDVAALAQLLADEQTCCSFFTFSLTVTDDAVIRDTTAPEDGRPMIYAVVGAPT